MLSVLRMVLSIKITLIIRMVRALRVLRLQNGAWQNVTKVAWLET